MKKVESSYGRLLFELARNDLKSRYSSSLLGILWAFAMPMATILVFWFVFQMGFRNPPVDDVPYILWFACAYIPWIFFSEALTTGCSCLTEYSYLVKKIRFNVMIIPAVKVLSAAIIHLFFIGILYLMGLVYGITFRIQMIQTLYYSAACGVLVLGLTYLLSALTVFFKDITSIVNIMVQIGFWVTPVLWDARTMVDEQIGRILSLNPMHYIVSGYRASVLEGVWFWENPTGTAYFWGITLCILLVGCLIFRKLLPFFADEV